MKNPIFRPIFPFLIFFSTIVPLVSHAQAFEGTITLEQSGPFFGDQKMDISITIKGDKTVTYMDIPGRGPEKIFEDKAAKKTTIVYLDQKRGAEVDLSGMDSITKPALPVNSTGRKELIKGFNAEEYSCQVDSGMEMRMWLTKEMPKDIAEATVNFCENSMKASGGTAAGFLALFNKGYVPVRTTMLKDGNLLVKIEFSKAEPKKIDDSEFVIPSDIGKLLYINGSGQ
jgi:roadblock/LC7 domain-containing protein